MQKSFSSTEVRCHESATPAVKNSLGKPEDLTISQKSSKDIGEIQNINYTPPNLAEDLRLRRQSIREIEEIKLEIERT